MNRWKLIHMLVSLVVATTAGLFPSTASAHELWKRSAIDPKELGTCDPSSPCLGWDMRSVTLRIRVGDNGLRYLTITLRSYYPQGGFASGFALDAKGDGKADYRGFLDQARLADETVAGPGRSRCAVRLARPDSRFHFGAYRTLKHGSVATCRLPLHWVQHTRSIRWRIWTKDLFPQPGPTLDRAPDHGWSG